MEDVSQQITTNIEIKTIKIKTSFTLTIGGAYTPSKTKILAGELAAIIQPHENGLYVIGGDLNAKLMTIYETIHSKETQMDPQ